MNILLIAYKIESHKGSEDGTGYHLIKALLQKEKNITLITRTNNVDKLRSDPFFNGVDVVGIDVPKALGFFKNKQRGIILYYYLWQICVGLKVRALQKAKSFDIIHQLNFHTTWAPHFIFSKKTKILWGPVTHHQPVPHALWFGNKYWREVLKNTIKRMFWYCDPFLLWATARTDKIFYSAQTIHWPYAACKNKLQYMTYAGSAFPVLKDRPPQEDFNILFVGRLTNLKGAVLALSAIHKFIQDLETQEQLRVSATIIGEGELHTEVAALAQIITSATGVKVNFLPWLLQEDLAQYYQTASVFLYPSFEGQGLVVAEALANGCPIVCFENTGPHDVAGIAAITVKPQHLLAETVKCLAGKLDKLFQEFQSSPVEYGKRIEASLARATELDWQRTADKMLETYHAEL